MTCWFCGGRNGVHNACCTAPMLEWPTFGDVMITVALTLIVVGLLLVMVQS